MTSSKLRLTRAAAALWVTFKMIVSLAVVGWTICPYPYTWSELGTMYPGLQFGGLFPVLLAIALKIRIHRRSSRESSSPRAQYVGEGRV
jgi:hypothetical protein